LLKDGYIECPIDSTRDDFRQTKELVRGIDRAKEIDAQLFEDNRRLRSEAINFLRKEEIKSPEKLYDMTTVTVPDYESRNQNIDIKL
jgi:hypothetical protein